MEFTRRQFLVGSAAALSQGAQAMIPDVSGPFIDRLATLSWEKEVRQLAPRPDIGLNASYKIPGAEIARLYGAQIIPLHMKHLFLEGFNKGTKIVAGHSPDLYFDYLRGVNDAGRRGQPTTMVLEMPVDHSVGQEEWQKYLEWLVPQIQASPIVIGNEMWGTELVGGRMNGSRSNWGTHWDQYARLFGMAHDVIRKLSPETRVILTAPHYFGDNGEIMANQLYAINQLNQERQKLGQALIGIDGAALHFYDIAHKMPAYVLGQRKVLNDYGYDVPVYITEHGVNENEGGSTGYDRRVQAQYAFQQAAVAAALVESKVITTSSYYTAWSEPEPEHSLFEMGGRGLVPTPAFRAFEMARRLLRSNVGIPMNGGMVEITGSSKAGDCKLIWNLNEGAVETTRQRSELFRFDGEFHRIRGDRAVLPGRYGLSVPGGVVERCDEVLVEFIPRKRSRSRHPSFSPR